MLTSTLAVILLTATTAPGNVWLPMALSLDQEVPVDVVADSLHVTAARFAMTDQGHLQAELTLELSGASARLGVVLLGATGQPLLAAAEQVSAPAAGHPDNLLTALLRLRYDLGVAPAGAKWFAIGPVERAVASGNLLALSSGGKVVGCSSTYGGSYLPETVIDDNANTCWASETGKIEDEWLLCQVPGAEPRRIASIGINPKAESGYPDCAVKDFTVLGSATDTEEGSFTELVSGRCEKTDQVQVFHFAPTPVRYLKLVCHTNYGNRQWMELTAFEAYPAEATDETAPPAVLVEDFETGQPSAASARADPAVMVEDLGFALLDLQEGKPTRTLRVNPAPQQTWPVDRLAAKEGACSVANESGPGWEARFGRLTYDFGNLLGGAPQRCGVVFDRLLPGRPTRLQWLARGDVDSLPCGALVVDSQGEAFELDAARLPKGSWQPVTVELDPARARYRGGEVQNGAIDYPVRLVEVYARPAGLKGLAGTLDLDDVMALSPAEVPAP